MAEDKRNIGIDMLRIMSMFGVVLLHVLGHGGIMDFTKVLSVNYELSWLIRLCSACAVDCYVLITGYVMCNTEYKIARILNLWLQVCFYSVVITMIFKITGMGAIGMKDIILSFFPVLSNQYWFFTMYLGLFFLIPFLNLIVEKLTKDQMSSLILTSLLIFSVTQTFSRKDLFSIGWGFSTGWFIVLYLVGAYLKKYDIPEIFQKSQYKYIYLYSVGITFIFKFALDIFSIKVFKELKFPTWGSEYTAPLILASAVGMLVGCSRLQIKNSRIKKTINSFAPLSFGVYLIHDNSLIREYVIKNKFLSYVSFNPLAFLVAVFCTALGIYLLGAGGEFLRRKLFEVIRIENVEKNKKVVCLETITRKIL